MSQTHRGLVLSPRTMEKYVWLLKLFGPEFGRRPIADITPAEVLHELKHHERRGRLETAKRMRSFASRVFRYAAATTRAERDPAQLLLGALIQPRAKHFAAITDSVEFGALIRAIEDYSREVTLVPLADVFEVLLDFTRRSLVGRLANWSTLLRSTSSN
ncbi:tyrosine-type recombinase/integrase [Novosphingobium sp.]|uniref:tyrosine-type recombinase/integrase n=1 Tax=Novosphingobium sp. TaxID=1874826 RepID=UPI003B52E546